MVILLILAIVFAMLVVLKWWGMEGVSLSMIVYAVACVVCLVIYLIGFIEKKREERM